jgi:hypothetical protein
VNTPTADMQAAEYEKGFKSQMEGERFTEFSQPNMKGEIFDSVKGTKEYYASLNGGY